MHEASTGRSHAFALETKTRYIWLLMSTKPSTDEYTSGMVHWSEGQFELTPSLDRWHFELLQPYLGSKILEVGAGAGRITALAAEAGGHDELLAIEPSPHFFELLQRRAGSLPKTTLMQTEAGGLLPHYAVHFDSVFSVHVMEHIEHDRAFLEEMLALTRPGGSVIILVPALPFLFSELDRNIGHYRRYNKKMVRTLIQDLPVEIQHLAYNNFLGVLGSLCFSKVGKINYQKDDSARRKFFAAYRFFSEYVVPGIRVIEKFVPVPVGLNLTVVLRKR
jgi:SAM-dependent methyltransferase